MSRIHAEYERFCVFAVAGQLSLEDANELFAHTETCHACQTRLADMELVSRACFMHQAGKAKARELPTGMKRRGMDRRFRERAEGAGIRLRDTSSALLGMRAVSVAFSILILTLAGQVAWKVFNPQMLHQGINHSQAASVRDVPPAPAALPSAVHGSLVQGPFKAGLNTAQNRRRFRSAFYASSPRVEIRGKNFSALYQPMPRQQWGRDSMVDGAADYPPSTVRDLLTSRLRFPVRRTFALTSAPAVLMEGAYSVKNERAFRYTPTLASLSLLGLPERFELPGLPSLNEPPSFFRLDSTKTW